MRRVYTEGGNPDVQMPCVRGPGLQVDATWKYGQSGRMVSPVASQESTREKFNLVTTSDFENGPVSPPGSYMALQLWDMVKRKKAQPSRVT